MFLKNVSTFELENGLKVYLINDKNTLKMSGHFLTKFGSNILESKKGKIIPGTAHFLEHMMFAHKEEDFFSQFAKQNATSNAYTSHNITNYYFTTSENYLNNLEILINLVTNTHFTDELVDKERKIIHEELLMYEKDSASKLQNLVFETICNNTNYVHDIGGSTKDIKRIDKDHLQMVFDEYYVQSNQVLILHANFDEVNIKEFLDEKFNTTRKEYTKKDTKKEDYLVNEELKIEKNKKIDLNSVQTVFKFDTNLITSHKSNVAFKIYLLSKFSEMNDNFYKLQQGDKIPDTGNRFHLSEDLNYFSLNYDVQELKDYHENIIKLFVEKPDKKLIELQIKKMQSSLYYDFEDQSNLVNAIINSEIKNYEISEYFDYIENLNVNTVLKDSEIFLKNYSITQVVLEKE